MIAIREEVKHFCGRRRLFNISSYNQFLIMLVLAFHSFHMELIGGVGPWIWQRRLISVVECWQKEAGHHQLPGCCYYESCYCL